jgi:hypothetical protein
MDIDISIAELERSRERCMDGKRRRELSELVSLLIELKHRREEESLGEDTACHACGHDPMAGTKRAIEIAEKVFEENHGEVGAYLGVPVTFYFSKKALMGCLISVGRYQVSVEKAIFGDMAYDIYCPSCRKKMDEKD